MPKPVIATSSAKSEDRIQNIVFYFFFTREVQMKKFHIFIVEQKNWYIDRSAPQAPFQNFYSPQIACHGIHVH